MKKIEFWSTIRVGKDDVGITLRKGYTDGEYNYFYAGYKDWWIIDPESGLFITRGETKTQARDKAIAMAEKVAQAKAAKFYKNCVENFKTLRLYGGQCTLKQINKRGEQQ